MFDGVTAQELNLGEFFRLLKTYFKSADEKASKNVDLTVAQTKAAPVNVIWIGNTAFLSVLTFNSRAPEAKSVRSVKI